MGRTHGWVTSVSLLCNDNDDDDGDGISSVRPEFLVNKTTKYPQFGMGMGLVRSTLKQNCKSVILIKAVSTLP